MNQLILQKKIPESDLKAVGIRLQKKPSYAFFQKVGAALTLGGVTF